LQSHGARSELHVAQRGLGIRGIRRIDQHGNTGRFGHQLAQELQALRCQLDIEHIDAGQVAAGPGEAGDKTKPDRILADHEDDGDRRGRCLGRDRRRGARAGNDHGDPAANQVGCQLRQTIHLALGPAV
jgi:hypothetical protein